MKTVPVLRLAAPLALLSLAPLPAQALSLDRQYILDWNIYCKDDRYCIAATNGTSANGDQMRFKLERSDRPGGIIFVTTAPDGDSLAVGMKVRIAVDGQERAFSGEIKRVYENNEMAFREKTESGLLGILKNGTNGRVSVSYGGATGTKDYKVSLRGVASVLALMDIVQGRLEREDAAIVKGGESQDSASSFDFREARAPEGGGKDEKAVEGAQSASQAETTVAAPPPQPAPSQEPFEPVGYLAYDFGGIPPELPGFASQMPNGCDLRTTIDSVGVGVVRTKPNENFYMVPCSDQADANFPYFVAMQSSGKTELLRFQKSGGNGNRVVEVINPDVNPDTGAITMIEYFSPNYDCGKQETHYFDPDTRQYWLSEVRLKESCDGNAGPPNSWPVDWDGEGG